MNKRQLWARIARRLPSAAEVDVYQAVRAAQLGIYRVSGRRVGYSPQLYTGEALRQRFERRRVPGMTTDWERAYFKWHAQEVFTGAGSLVDLGSFMGSTTASLAMGLTRNRRPAAAKTTIEAYDRFVWELEMGYHSPPTRFGPYEIGSSFVREFEYVVRRWADRIRIHEGDLLKESWGEAPIELLLVDAMKSWDLATHIGTVFYPAVMADDGYLIHQDFSHCFTPWIPLTMFRLLDYVAVEKDVSRSETMVFRVRRSFPAGSMARDMVRSAYDEPEIEAAYEYWIGVSEQWKHSGLRTGRVLLAHNDGDADRADWLRRSYEKEGLITEWHQKTLGWVLDAK